MLRTELRVYSRLIRAMLAAGIAGAAALIRAAEPATHSVYIPPEDLGTALLEFAAVTHQQIAFDRKLVEGYQSSPLSGTYTVTDGLRTLIGSAPFLIHATPSGVLTLAAVQLIPKVPASAGSAAHQASPPAASPGAAQSTATTLEAPSGVTIEARRARLEQQVTAFVSGIVGSPQEPTGLARWVEAICPLVSGPRLAPKDAEFILARITDLARQAGVPFAEDKCRNPNLYVLLTDRPAELLSGMNRRNHSFTFADAPSSLIDGFIATPRPVRVWYHITLKTPEDTPLAGMSFPSDTKDTRVQFRGVNFKSQESHLTFNVIWDIYRVFVIVDQSRLQGATREQLGDYIAMVSLAQLEADPQLADAPSILTLFERDARTAPDGASDWDTAFLNALYRTDQKSVLQRTLIAREMVREIAR